MKNKNFLIFSVLLVLTLGLWVWFQRPGLPVDRVLPSHPLVFARLEHAQEHINQAINSDIGKNIAAIDLPDVLNRNNFPPKDINDFQYWTNR